MTLRVDGTLSDGKSRLDWEVGEQVLRGIFVSRIKQFPTVIFGLSVFYLFPIFFVFALRIFLIAAIIVPPSATTTAGALTLSSNCL